MQQRMKTHQLTDKETESLLLNCMTGTLATVNSDGTPYNVPVHYVFFNNSIYIHGLPVGQKISNLKANANICFNIYEMQGLLMDKDGKPCDTNTAYTSVVIQGKAQVVDELNEKKGCIISSYFKVHTTFSGKRDSIQYVKGNCGY